MASEKLREWKYFDLWQGQDKSLLGKPLIMQTYRNKHGDYIAARHKNKRPGIIKMIAELEIVPELVKSGDTVCSVGKSNKDDRWYGWSHRGATGFAIGDKIFDVKWKGNGEDLSEVLFTQRGSKTITTDAEARVAAVNFAKYVS